MVRIRRPNLDVDVVHKQRRELTPARHPGGRVSSAGWTERAYSQACAIPLPSAAVNPLATANLVPPVMVGLSEGWGVVCQNLREHTRSPPITGEHEITAPGA